MMFKRLPKLISPLIKSYKPLFSFSEDSDPLHLKVRSPYSNEVVYETNYMKLSDAHNLLKITHNAQKDWSRVPLETRITSIQKVIDYFYTNFEKIAKNITLQMGKPITQSRNEIKGMIARIKVMMELAPKELSPEIIPTEGSNFMQIARQPVGLVFIISPWNYPLLTTVNTLIAAVLAGNTVIIKHSPYTPLCGKMFEDAFETAGLKNIVNDCLVTLEDCQDLLTDPLISYVNFTGSVASGKFVYEKIVSSRTTDFIDVGLELGGKDAIYLAEDYDVKQAAESLMDGAMYNAGQSCCSVERIFVHKNLYDDFLQHSCKFLQNYKLEDPLLDSTTMGPLTLPTADDILKSQVEDAVAQGAKLMIGGLPTTDGKGKGRFFEPTLVAEAENDMNMMVDESFGPIIGICSVENDEEALKYINDSKFGLTAGIYTKDKERAMVFGEKCNVGTVFMNRCDALSPYLPWTGRNLSGKGISLSKYGFHAVTKTKGFNFNMKK